MHKNFSREIFVFVWRTREISQSRNAITQREYDGYLLIAFAKEEFFEIVAACKDEV